MKYQFLEPAKKELDAAVAFYEQQQEGLGNRFAKEVQDAIAGILDHPYAWGKLSKNTRCCLTKRFSYSIVYHITQGTLSPPFCSNPKFQKRIGSKYLGTNDLTPIRYSLL